MSRSKSKSRNKKCYDCGKTGHFIKGYKRKNEQKDEVVDEENVVKPIEPNTVEVYAVTKPVSDQFTANIADKTPSSSLDGKTPKQPWSRKSPDYSHLRTFGCAAYPHQSVEKLEASAQNGVFVTICCKLVKSKLI
ncbi:Uncharacterized protein Adt_02982 [Abeliophyllum distichum]|uniref:CCHC-type domain-containing protein n=1 Tax=Abeliophyllum distichum TaxID=126358 RepID=A0ABD1VX81_9LAMI